MPSPKSRLDMLLVERGLCATRARARDAIKRGHVTVGRAPASKPGLLVAPDVALAIAGDANPYVSRGGLKLARALDVFGYDPAGAVVIDLGASTGGFTDVLLRRGAARVFAVDVGHDQLHVSLRDDPRVVSLERLNARDLTLDHVPPHPDLIVCDVSFISLKLALPGALALAGPQTRLIVLVKPQFEVGRTRLGKGGVVRETSLHDEVCQDTRVWLEGQGWRVDGIEGSPVEGPDGNREFLLMASRP